MTIRAVIHSLVEQPDDPEDDYRPPRVKYDVEIDVLPPEATPAKRDYQAELADLVVSMPWGDVVSVAKRLDIPPAKLHRWARVRLGLDPQRLSSASV